MAQVLPVFLILQHPLLNKPHGCEHTLMVFLRCQHLERRLVGNLDVHTHAVGILSRLTQKFTACPWNALQVDVAIEVMHRPQVLGYRHQTLHRVVRIPHHPTAQEQPLDVVPSIELHHYLLQLMHRQRCPLDIVTPSVDAVGTIIHAVVRQHHFQQRDATSIIRKRVTDAHTSHRVPHHTLFTITHSATRRARHIVLRRFSQNAQLLQGLFCQHKYCKNDCATKLV